MAEDRWIEAYLREKVGQEARLAQAKEDLEKADTPDAEEFAKRRVADAEQGIKNVNAALKAEGYKAKPPAKRAETRPESKKEER
jgi:hypothetical protein